LRMKNGEPRAGANAKNKPKDIVGRTFDFAVLIIRLCMKLDAQPGVGRVLMSQLLRTGTSVAANVEEAQAAQSKADFVSKMSIALKEARETHLRLRLLFPTNVISCHELEPLIQEADEIKRVIGAIIVTTKQGKVS